MMVSWEGDVVGSKMLTIYLFIERISTELKSESKSRGVNVKRYGEQKSESFKTKIKSSVNEAQVLKKVIVRVILLIHLKITKVWVRWE